MLGKHLRVGMTVNGRRIIKASTGTATFRVAQSQFLAPARLVTFEGDPRPTPFELDRPARGKVMGYAEPLPAGNVASANVQGPPKVRASDGKWRGESVHGMPTREHDLIARTNMFDVGRVNGVVGSRPGAGSVADTGPSFPGR